MKKGLKFTLGAAALATGIFAVSSCTQSFCSPVDTARIMYAFAPGITYYEADETAPDMVFEQGEYKLTIKSCKPVVANWNTNVNIFDYAGLVGKPEYESYMERIAPLNNAIMSSRNKGYPTVDASSIEYYQLFDEYVLDNMMNLYLLQSAKDAGYAVKEFTLDLKRVNGEIVEYKTPDHAAFDRAIARYSYIKFITSDIGSMWDMYNKVDKQVRETVVSEKCPGYDFTITFCSSIQSNAATYRTCLTTKEDMYGSYGYSTEGVYINAKSWGYAWSKGFFEGLLVYPIGWLVDQIVGGFVASGSSAGWAACLGIVFITLILRSLMLLATFKQTKSSAKMTELQPEIQKIQAKYPNANSSQIEKQRMAEEMNRLYKKNKVNPFTSLLVMIIQFPVFICVWGALSGSSAITNGTLLGMRLDLGIKDMLFSAKYWTAAGSYGAVTALLLFLFMALAQTVSMLLPQFIQKMKAKNSPKLGKNPAQSQQNKTMKIFTYVMLALIIFMGFSLVSAMGIYWFIGALFSIGQTLITQVAMKKHSKK